MKTNLFIALLLSYVIASFSIQKAHGQANTQLSNLVSTSVNQSLTSFGDSVKDVGASARAWNNGYFYHLRLKKNKTGNAALLNSNGIELGYGVIGKEINAGKISYGEFTPNTLDIVGAGNSSSTRAIRFWAEGGASFIGNAQLYGHSTVSKPQLLIAESQSDYARINFQNASSASLFAIAGLTATNAVNAKLNFYYSGFGDIMTLKGNGNVGVNNTNPEAVLDLTSSRTGHAFRSICNASYGFGVTAISSYYAGYFIGDIGYTGVLYQTSDMRLKENIHPIDKAIDKVMMLKPSSYNYRQEFSKMNLPKGQQSGFIAQEMEKVLPELVRTLKDTQADSGRLAEYKGINYIGLIPLLTKAMQEQQLEINELRQQLKQLSSGTGPVVYLSDASLGQNIPNPAINETSIAYNIPTIYKSGNIVIFDADGKMIKQIEIKATGKDALRINTNGLSNGVYTYTLFVDGKTVESKKMIIGK